MPEKQTLMRALVAVSRRCSGSTKNVSSCLKFCDEGRIKKVVTEELAYDHNPEVEVSKPMGTGARGRK